ncbi:MAG: hypothetical protein KAV87_22060 [Desulfobacteraceae bacterium]|nr:hypothetical protein [Desulfobacteraceae bacterium]
MEILNGSEYAVPLWQVGFLLVVVTGSMLFRRTKLGLLTIYAFALYWGYLFHSQLFFGAAGA